ncbi:uncharacterized protein LOC107013284 [Solanum pennellii]|uniref:Uncharacterized protein LOC107013284 n=1 Tax=Solanum pennellii TaxID=28526 RepID=A0ABM1GBK7_SOLPN|nr:uncharacterized protein LOC107013284 [Solanum pennellii]
MNTRSKAVRRVGEEIVNAGDTPQGNRVPPQVQTLANEQLLGNPPAMTDGEVRAVLFQMVQAITTQTQAIMAQANREVVPREKQHASTMASRLRDFTRINPPIYEKNRYVTGVYEYLEEEYHAAMLHNNMDLSRLMVHAQQVEESRLRRSNRESKKARNFKSGSSNS